MLPCFNSVSNNETDVFCPTATYKLLTYADVLRCYGMTMFVDVLRCYGMTMFVDVLRCYGMTMFVDVLRCYGMTMFVDVRLAKLNSHADSVRTLPSEMSHRLGIV